MWLSSLCCFFFFFSLRKSCKNHSRGGGKARHEEAGHKGKIIPYPNRISRITFYNRRRGPSQSKGPLEINYFNYIGWMSEWLSPFSGHVEITGLLSGSKSIDGPTSHAVHWFWAAQFLIGYDGGKGELVSWTVTPLPIVTQLSWHYLGVPSFLGVPGRFCQKWPGMVKASTFMDIVLDGMAVNCLRSELYL